MRLKRFCTRISACWSECSPCTAPRLRFARIRRSRAAIGRCSDRTSRTPARTETEDGISARNVRTLKTKWSFDDGRRRVSPGGRRRRRRLLPRLGWQSLRAPGGDRQVKWSRQLSTYGLTGSSNGVYHSRTSPAVDDDVVYIGTQEAAWLLAISAKTGRLIGRRSSRPGRGSLRDRSRRRPSSPTASSSPASHRTRKDWRDSSRDFRAATHAAASWPSMP